MQRVDAIICAGAACAISAALEGLAAGRGVRVYLSSLRMPRFAPPLIAWYAIGGAYYVLFFTVIYRILRLNESVTRTGALAFITVLLITNILWNWTFFRRQNRWLTLLLSIPYSAV